MSEGALTPERVLDAAEDVLRRFGPTKANVVDVARALGVSHGSVYRHFDSKVALREAVAERWLERLCAPLDEVVAGPEPALERIHLWFQRLGALKRARRAADPELFATYVALAGESRAVIGRHVDHLLGQLRALLDEAVARGELAPMHTAEAARALFDATARFHNPAHAVEWADPGIEAAFERVWGLLRAGLRAPAEQHGLGSCTGGEEVGPAAAAS